MRCDGRTTILTEATIGRVIKDGDALGWWSSKDCTEPAGMRMNSADLAADACPRRSKRSSRPTANRRIDFGWCQTKKCRRGRRGDEGH
mmetsp:Transcript_28563/g.60280  ORF Transcript_28563/g.60280 Transcript_28563/m.60280 type:complete len:88 (-) Transcript_28563:110-373(-)